MPTIFCNDWKKVDRKIDHFLDFCLKNSEYVVLTKRASSVPENILHKMAEEEIERTKLLLEKQLEYASKVSKAELQRLDLRDRKALEKQLRWQANDRISTVRKMEEDYAGKGEKLEENMKPYHLVDHEYKFGSFFTWPGVWDICTFSKSDFTIEELKRIYLNAGIELADYDFEDLGFKDKDGKIWMKTCLHEGYLQMDLSKEQFEEFKRLQIPLQIGG